MPYNILNAKTGVILHQVNCQGVMASGAASALRQKYPEIYLDYFNEVLKARNLFGEQNASKHLLGKFTKTQVSNTLTIINVFGQEYYGREPHRYTSYDALDEAFGSIALAIGNQHVHVPDMLGCGLGGGKRNVVKALLDEHFKEYTLWNL